MIALDKIRLIGLLRRGPVIGGAPLFVLSVPALGHPVVIRRAVPVTLAL